MQRDFVLLVIVIILGGNTLVLLSSEDASDPNLIDIEDLTCSFGEILVSNTSLAEGYECTEFDPHSITHPHPAPVLSVSNVIDDGSTIAILGDIDHLHPDEITVKLSLDENFTISTKPNTDGTWSLTVQSGAEYIYINITATHDLEERSSDTNFIEINRTTPEDGDGDTGQPQNSSILSAYHGLDELPVVAGEVVLGDQQDLERVGDVPGQRRIRGLPVATAEEREVLALIERHVVVRVPDVLGNEVASEFFQDDGLEFEGQCVSDRFLGHAVTVTQFCGNRKISTPNTPPTRRETAFRALPVEADSYGQSNIS